jgi:hypothetical protein
LLLGMKQDTVILRAHHITTAANDMGQSKAGTCLLEVREFTNKGDIRALQLGMKEDAVMLRAHHITAGNNIGQSKLALDCWVLENLQTKWT